MRFAVDATPRQRELERRRSREAPMQIEGIPAIGCAKLCHGALLLIVRVGHLLRNQSASWNSRRDQDGRRQGEVSSH